jgi:predicted RNA-binding Zn ribbon-like protein
MMSVMEVHDRLPARAGADLEPSPELLLLQEFINTNDVESEVDELATPSLLNEWLAARGLIAAQQPIDGDAHRRAIAIREGLRALGMANNEEPLDAARVDALNQAAASLPVVVSVGPNDWWLTPAAAGVDGFLAHVMATLARSMADGSWSRMKSCRSDTCRWVFFDHSRNRSGTWCSMRVCGSRMKARTYRARQRGAASADRHP